MYRVGLWTNMYCISETQRLSWLVLLACLKTKQNPLSWEVRPVSFCSDQFNCDLQWRCNVHDSFLSCTLCLLAFNTSLVCVSGGVCGCCSHDGSYSRSLDISGFFCSAFLINLSNVILSLLLYNLFMRLRKGLLLYTADLVKTLKLT